MSKFYGDFKAIDQLNLNLYKDEIFCFLGHNGAGKTTSLNVLIGQLYPDEGTITINMKNNQKLDIKRDLNRAQAMMGSCAQHDILFDTLSVEQHLRLLLELKSIRLPCCGSPETISNSQRVNNLINAVKLNSHRDFESQQLSGGMQRRLSIAMALASPTENSIVILDEPTTGLDALVREEVWQMIKSLKKGRCIVMTTQHLQEAEELADQVALLDQGKLVQKGTVDEIKKKFGVGYNLRITFDDTVSQLETEEKLHDLIPGLVSETSNNKHFRNYILPFN